MTAAGVAYHYRPRRRTSTEWMEQAKCLGYRHPETGVQFTEATVPEQIAVCHSGCPVQAECGLYAVEGPPAWEAHDGTVGVVYGAMRPATIKRLQKARGAS